MAHVRRGQLFVDGEVQRALVWRVGMYWATCMASAAMLLLIWRIVSGPSRLWYTHLDSMWFYFGPAAVVALALLPIIIFDALRFSNRFVGPIVRLRDSMRRLARGEHVEPIDFRGDDFWCRFAEEYNAVIALVQDTRLEPEQAGPQACAEEPAMPCKVG